MSTPAPATAVRDFYSFDDLIASEHRPPHYAVEDLLIEGQHGILAGPYAIGKTYLGLQLSVSLATGRDFMGRGVTKPYRVLFVDLENGAAEFKSRSARLVERLEGEDRCLLAKNWRYSDGTDPEDPLYGLSLDTSGFERLEKYVAYHGPEVIILDCYGKAVRWEESNEEATKGLLERIAQFQRRTSLSHGLFLQFHHPTKHSGDSSWPNLLENPREWLGKVRGTGRLLDFSPIRLGFDRIDAKDGESIYVLNGFTRGQLSPLVLERDGTGSVANSEGEMEDLRVSRP
jgi:AAA domain